MLQSLARAQRINFRVCPKTFNEVWDLRQSKTRRIFYTTVYVAKPAAPPYRRCLMAKKPTEGRRKLVEFDAPTWHALNLLARVDEELSGACRRGVPEPVAQAGAAD
jgi:hypothetical protein